MTLRAGSLCTGYGGLDLALEAVLGTELAWVADSDPGAAKILGERFPAVANLGDITKTDWAAVAPVDVLTAGFPCQDISCAGKRAGMREGTRSGLWYHVARAIAALRPPLVVIENVKELLSERADSDMEQCPWCLGDTSPESAMRALGAVLADLAEIGFDAEWLSIPAAAVGACHLRWRVFILAWPADPGSAGLEVGQEQHHGPELAAIERSDRDRPAADPDGSGRGIEPRADGRWWRGRVRAAGYGPGTAQDPDCATGSERRFPAPGQETGRGTRANTGGPGGTPAAADAERDRQPGWPASASGEADEWGEGSRTAVAGRGADAPADADSTPRGRHQPWRGPSPVQGTSIAERPQEQPGRLHSGSGDTSAVAWGAYEPAIRRWEAVLGRPAPRPTEPGRTGERLSPAFVEWMQGLTCGWVTDVPGLSRNAQLKALGNGVVPQQAELALRLLLARITITGEAVA